MLTDKTTVLYLPSGVEGGLAAAPAIPRGAWLAACESAHGSHRGAPAIGTDAAAIAGLAVLGATPALPAVVLVASFVAVGLFTGLYRNRSCLETQGVAWYARVLAGSTAVFAVLLVLFPGLDSSAWRSTLDAAAVGAARDAAVIGGLLLLLRTGLWLVVASRRRAGHGLRPALVSGPAAAVEQVARRVPAFPESGLEIVAVHIPKHGPDQRSPHRGGEPPDGQSHKRALDLIDRRQVAHVLLVAAGGDRGTYDELVHRGEGSGIDYSVVVPLAALSERPFRHRLGDLGVVPLGKVNYSSRRMPGKRAFDLVVGSLLVVVLAPVLAAAALAVFLHDRGPVLYGQLRVGRGGRMFRMLKFRSMVVDADRRLAVHADDNVGSGLLFKLAHDPRVTRVGAVLRRLSLDELPQLFNVVRGDMSLVGPRPLPVSPADFDEVATKRHSVRPGITGPWQVHGGNALSYDDMVALDLAYISSWSLRADLWMLLRTVPALLVRRAPC